MGDVMKHLMIAWLLVAGFSANAEANNSKFSCTYGSDTESPQVVTFEGPPNIDLSYPVGQETIPLTMNGSPTPTIFNVGIVWTKVGHRVTYSYRNPIWVSDIVITYEEDEPAKSTWFTGTWIVDYPPVINLSCNFQN